MTPRLRGAVLDDALREPTASVATRHGLPRRTVDDLMARADPPPAPPARTSLSRSGVGGRTLSVVRDLADGRPVDVRTGVDDPALVVAAVRRGGTVVVDLHHAVRMASVPDAVVVLDRASIPRRFADLLPRVLERARGVLPDGAFASFEARLPRDGRPTDGGGHGLDRTVDELLDGIDAYLAVWRTSDGRTAARRWETVRSMAPLTARVLAPLHAEVAPALGTAFGPLHGLRVPAEAFPTAMEAFRGESDRRFALRCRLALRAGRRGDGVDPWGPTFRGASDPWSDVRRTVRGQANEGAGATGSGSRTGTSIATDPDASSRSVVRT